MVFLPAMSVRNLQPELMDDPALDPRLHDDALKALRRLNRLSGAASILWRPLKVLALEAKEEGRILRVLDVATGSGDVPIELARRAAREHLPMELHGCDLSPHAVRVAQESAALAGVPVRFFGHDALHAGLSGYDVALCSLFTHHLQDHQVVSLLRTLAATAEHVLVSDLRRSRAAYAGVYLGSRLVTRSPVARTDALISIGAAFTIAEFRALAAQAGLDDAVVRAAHPCRLLLRWSRA